MVFRIKVEVNLVMTIKTTCDVYESPGGFSMPQNQRVKYINICIERFTGETRDAKKKSDDR
jgi:hypothetical protein